MNNSNTTTADVIILGSSISGSMLASILAKKGLDVLMTDAGSHPRFAIGEATTPDSSHKLKLLAEKYDIPEIDHIATFYKLQNNVTSSCGVKRSFSFLYHTEGQDQQPEESHQFPTLAPPLGPDCHFFRQDVDAFLMSAAVKYGARIRQNTSMESISFDAEGVSMTDSKAHNYRCKYVVDASGFRSFLAKELDLRDSPEKMRTNSRAIFTHMVDVNLYDRDCDPRAFGLPSPVSQGTLHHVFEGGWFWVIPFNNHQEAVNPLCSVGLLLNRELYPETGMDAEEEFFMFVNKFPAMKKQFEKARAVRSWVSTGRLQYCSKKIVGDRYCLAAHAAGFVDPLYSSGINLTASVADLLAERLLIAFEEQDFATERFEIVDEFFQNGLRQYDEIVSGSFIAFRNFDLWDAWFRIYVAGSFVGTAMNVNIYLQYKNSKDRSHLYKSKEAPYIGVMGDNFEVHRTLFDKALHMIDEVKAGTMEPSEAAKGIRALFKDAPYIPNYYKLHDPKVRKTPPFTLWQSVKLYMWFYLFAPKEIREPLFNWHALKSMGYVLGTIWHNKTRFGGRKAKLYTRDVWRAWNTDWKYV